MIVVLAHTRLCGSMVYTRRVSTSELERCTCAKAWNSFLILPSQFDPTVPLRVSRNFLAIFSVALLTAGFSLTGLLCFAVQNHLFRADTVFLPALSSCALGLLTVFYSFLVSSRYTWNTAALLTTIAAAVSTVVYGALLLWTHRLVGSMQNPQAVHIPLRQSAYTSPGVYQDPAFYNNYLANMHPTATL